MDVIVDWLMGLTFFERSAVRVAGISAVVLLAWLVGVTARSGRCGNIWKRIRGNVLRGEWLC